MAPLNALAAMGIGVANDRILVTGAAGFVGSAVARALTAAGFQVRGLVRAASSRTNLADLEIEIAEGDMRDPGAVARAMSGVRFVMHVAADYRLWAPEPNDILRANCDGTRTVMQAALKAGVEKIVYTSSVATLAASKSGESIDETKPLRVENAIGAYKRSKILAERIVAEMIAQERLPAVIVHPSTPIGPRDVKPTPTGRIVIEAARGRMPGFVDTGLNLVHVDDVANGHIAALQRGEVGERYILGGQNVSLAAMLAEIARLSGRRAPRLRVPRGILYPFASLAEAKARFTGREPFLTRDGLRMSEYRMFFSSAKAERQLGFRARPYQQGLADALNWFRQHGYLQ